EIGAAGEVILAERRGGVARLFLGVFGELVRQVVGADDRQRIDAGLTARPEDFGDDAFAAVIGRRKADHLEDDLVVRLRALGAGVADVDAVAEHGAIDAHETLAVPLEVGADEALGGPFEDANDLAERTEVGPVRLARDTHEHGVAGGGVAGVFLVDADFGARLALDELRADVAGSGSGAAKGTGDGAVRLGGAHRVILTHLDAAVFYKGTQGAAKVGVLRRRDAELARQRLGLERLVVLAADGAEDEVFKSGH